MSGAIAANAPDLPQTDIPRAALEKLTEELRKLVSDQKLHQSAKQQISQRMKVIHSEGAKLATVLRFLVKQHYGKPQRQAGGARRQAAPEPRPQGGRRGGASPGHRAHPGGPHDPHHTHYHSQVVLVGSFTGRAERTPLFLSPFQVYGAAGRFSAPPGSFPRDRARFLSRRETFPAAGKVSARRGKFSRRRKNVSASCGKVRALRGRFPGGGKGSPHGEGSFPDREEGLRGSQSG
ncbi:MAG TPA: hypothetical protein VIA62_29410 [Thermoanaerobaculia bacterium]|nr:hypothetical protein [Thermoanaerobaculia bacterium]